MTNSHITHVTAVANTYNVCMHLGESGPLFMTNLWDRKIDIAVMVNNKTISKLTQRALLTS